MPHALQDAVGMLTADGALAANPPSQRPDFYAYTGPMRTYGTLDPTSGAVDQGEYAHLAELVKLIGKAELRQELEALPRPVLQATGSSTEQDLQGDIMYASALQDMTHARALLTIWRNHSYNLPDDLFGSLTRDPWLIHDSGFTDLWLQFDLETLNAASVQTYLYIQRGRQIGISGGFMVTESEYIERRTGKPVDESALTIEDMIGGAVALGVKHTQAVEWSTVGIPANQRSWVASAAKGIFQRTFSPLLAPIVRGLYSPAEWTNLLGYVPDSRTREQLREIAPRVQRAPRLYWVPLAGEFALEAGRSTRPITRQEVAQLLKTSALSNQSNGIADARYVVVTVTSHDDDADSDIGVKAAGDSSTASDRDTARAAQEARAKKYHIGIKDGGHVTKPGEWVAVPESKFGDPVNFRYPAHTEENARAALSYWGMPKNRKQYTSGEQEIVGGRIRRLARAQGVEVSDDDDESGHDTSNDKETKAAMPDKVPDKIAAAKKATPPVDTDGNHEPFTGAHTHLHKAFGSQGDDVTHEHAHEHSDDADHHHAHEKAVTPAVTKAPAPRVSEQPGNVVTKPSERPLNVVSGTSQTPVNEIKVDSEGSHEPVTGTHTHGHPTFGIEPDGTYTARAHSHEGDNHHDLDRVTGDEATEGVTPRGEPMGGAVNDKGVSLPAGVRDFLVKQYNDIGAQLGFRPVALVTTNGAPDAAKCALVGDATSAQRVITLVSQIDAQVDQICAANPYALDSSMDELMGLLGIPDMDKGEATADEAARYLPSTTPSYPVIASHGVTPTLTKRGARHSKGDMQMLQAIHDHTVALTDGLCCKGMPQTGDANRGGDDGDEDNEDARGALDNGGRGMPTNMPDSKALGDLAAGLTEVAKVHETVTGMMASFEALTKAVQEQGLPGLQQQAETLKTTVATYRQQVAALQKQVAQLQTTPLGWPTTHNRSVSADPAAVSYAEMAGLNGDNGAMARSFETLEAALTKTEIIEEPDGRRYRRWPQGVSVKGARPELTATEVAVMSQAQLLHYRAGDEAYVPVLEVPDGEE